MKCAPPSGLSGSPQKVCLRPLVHGNENVGFGQLCKCGWQLCEAQSERRTLHREEDELDGQFWTSEITVHFLLQNRQPTIVPWHRLNLSYCGRKKVPEPQQSPWSIIFDLVQTTWTNTFCHFFHTSCRERWNSLNLISWCLHRDDRLLLYKYYSYSYLSTYWGHTVFHHCGLLTAEVARLKKKETSCRQ